MSIAYIILKVNVMKNFQYERCSSIIGLLLSLLIHGCQQSHLQVRDEETSLHKADGATPVSDGILSTPATDFQASPKHLWSGTSTDTKSHEKIGDGGTTSMLPSRKRPAEALNQDIEEKKESPTALKQPVSRAASAIPVRSIAASMMQASQGASAMAVSPGQAATLTNTEQQDMVMAQQNLESISKKGSDEEDQKLSADLKHWFQAFSEAVDDEEVLSLGDISEEIPRLVREGKEKGYLNKSMKLVINEVGWEPDCTPLHYAAAKGNTQAVEALLRESEVVIDAKTEEAGTTPLQFAAYEGHLRAAEQLINAYKVRGKIEEIDAPDQQGTSALQYAALGPRGGMNRGVAELLVAQGADPTQLSDNISPLVCLSASAGNFAMVEYWIEEIAHTGRFSKEQEKDFIKRGIKLARRNRHTDIVTILQAYCRRMCT